MTQVNVQKAVVTLASTNEIYIEVDPVINTTQVQQVGVVVAGVNQTVTVRPVE